MPRGLPCTTLPAFFERVAEGASLLTVLPTLDAGHGFCADVGIGAGGSVFSSSSLQAIAAHPATRTTAHHVRRGIRISTAIIPPGLETTRIREERNSVEHSGPTDNRNLAHVHLHAAGRAIGARDPDAFVRNPTISLRSFLAIPVVQRHSRVDRCGPMLNAQCSMPMPMPMRVHLEHSAFSIEPCALRLAHCVITATAVAQASRRCLMATASCRRTEASSAPRAPQVDRTWPCRSCESLPRR
jgi:hypothetical protein